MNYLDYALLIGGALFTLLGIYWGFIRQVLSLAGLLVGIVMAGRYGPDVAAWLSSFVADPQLAGAIGFLAVLFLVSAAASFVASLLRVFAGLLFLGWLDHLLGGLLGLIQAALGGAAILLAMITFPSPAWSAAVADSQFAGGLLQVGGLLAPLLPELFQRALGA